MFTNQILNELFSFNYILNKLESIIIEHSLGTNTKANISPLINKNSHYPKYWWILSFHLTINKRNIKTKLVPFVEIRMFKFFLEISTLMVWLTFLEIDNFTLPWSSIENLRSLDPLQQRQRIQIWIWGVWILCTCCTVQQAAGSLDLDRDWQLFCLSTG